jgi:hypothetical protein
MTVVNDVAFSKKNKVLLPGVWKYHQIPLWGSTSRTDKKGNEYHSSLTCRMQKLQKGGTITAY